MLLMFTTACAQSNLPAIGDKKIPRSMLALKTQLQFGTKLVYVDFQGGITQIVEADPDDPNNSRLLKVVGFQMSAKLPADNGDSAGTIVIEQTDIDAHPQSYLRLTQSSPPIYEEADILSFTMTIAPENGSSLSKVKLTTRDPMKFTGTPTEFPPRGDLYKLQDSVDLISPDDPDTVVAIIRDFPVKIGGLPPSF